MHIEALSIIDVMRLFGRAGRVATLMLYVEKNRLMDMTTPNGTVAYEEAENDDRQGPAIRDPETSQEVRATRD